MRNISKIFFNLLLIILFFLSSLIFYTENVSSFDEEIIENIESKLDKSLSVKTNIDAIDIAWSGLKPKIIIRDLNLSNSKNQIILKTPLSELEIDIISSLRKGEINVGKFTINNTSVRLKYDDSSFSFNGLNFFKKQNELDNIEIPLIIFNNSELMLTNINTEYTENFKVDNLVASLKRNIINVNAKFIHSSSTEPITFIFRGNPYKSGMKSKIFLSANSIKLPDNVLPQSFKQLDADRMSVRLWISMLDTSIVRAAGNISSKSLNLKINGDLLNIKNVNSDLLFVNNDSSSTLSLMRMNYSIRDNKITNNKIVINKNSNDDIKIFIKKHDAKLFRLLIKDTLLNNIFPINKLIDSDISNLQIHLTKYNSIDYFSLSLKNLDFSHKEKYFMKNISADIYGTLDTGKIKINNTDILAKDLSIEQLSGLVAYNRKGKSFYFSGSDFINKQGHEISFTGKKTSTLPSFKIKVSTTLSKIIKSTKSKKLDSYNLNAIVKSNIYYHDGSFFTDNNIKDFYSKISESTYISVEDLIIFSSSNMVSSKTFNLSFNDKNQKSKINTIINSKSFQYTLTSIGNINADIVNNIFNMDKQILRGEGKVKSILSYDFNTKRILFYSTSDLSGMSIETIPLWSKEKNKKTDFVLNYQHFPKKSYPLKINLDKNEFEFKFSENNTYIKIKSPAVRGILKYPDKQVKEKIFSGSFEYIDTTFFKSNNLKDYFPAINIQSKHVKTSSTIFDNVHIIMTPKDEYIEITKLDFNNLNLAMKSKGKWFIKGNQNSEIIADIKSDNFGLALKGIGYPNTIKGGKMTANIKSKWEGSLEEFSFASSDSEIKLNIKDGQINELDKGTQAIGQVLGLLSIASIPKRLSLDFSDFFSKGLSFDDLKSKIVINSGIADINKMIIVGSFGEMRLSGESNLVKRVHNQTLIFIPDLSSTSIVTGAVIGGPIGAAASIFYDKLLKEFGVNTNKLAGIEYSIKGSWDDPEIKVTQAFKPIIN